MSIPYSIAKAMHNDQDYEGEPYKNHLKRISKKVSEAFSSDSDDEKALLNDVSWLKDVLASTDCSESYIRERLGNYHLFDRLMEALYAITPKVDEPEIDYMDRCSKNDIAFQVKIAEFMVKTEERMRVNDFDMARAHTRKLTELIYLYQMKHYR